LLQNSRSDPLLLWRACNLAEELSTKIIGQRFLRLDKRIEGYARLSPSILREFLTYTIVGLKDDSVNIELKAKDLLKKIKKISNDKLELSKEIISRLVRSQNSCKEIEEKTVFIIAGDVVYDMAHNESRPEPSTGETVRGSDLDIIIVTNDLSEDIVNKLDSSIYEEKYFLIKRPAYREEIDYLIKDLKRVREQMQFNSFEFMVASKILDEGKFLYGNISIFENVKNMLSENKIPEKLKKMEDNAASDREDARTYLLKSSEALTPDEYKNLFYTTEETEEIF